MEKIGEANWRKHRYLTRFLNKYWAKFDEKLTWMILKQIESSLVHLFVVLICWVPPRRPPLLLSGMTLGGTGGVEGVHLAGVVGGVGVGRCWGSGGGRLRQLVSRGPVGRAGGHVRPLRLLLETGMSPLQPKEKNWLCFNKCHLKVLKRRIYLRVYHHYYRLMKKRGNSAKGQFNGHYYLVFFGQTVIIRHFEIELPLKDFSISFSFFSIHMRTLPPTFFVHIFSYTRIESTYEDIS